MSIVSAEINNGDFQRIKENYCKWGEKEKIHREKRISKLFYLDPSPNCLILKGLERVQASLFGDSLGCHWCLPLKSFTETISSIRTILQLGMAWGNGDREHRDMPGILATPDHKD